MRFLGLGLRAYFRVAVCGFNFLAEKAAKIGSGAARDLSLFAARSFDLASNPKPKPEMIGMYVVQFYLKTHTP